MKRYLILLATVLLVLGILSGCAEVRLANTQAVSWQITPETQQESGKTVGVDSVFLLTLDGKLDEDQVRSSLQIEPAVEYQLQQQEDSVWKLTPEEELKSGKVYAFQVKDRLGQVQQSFAFQTQAQLEVSSTYPEDGAKYVEPNSGIEITFNRRIQEGAEEHFQIEPAVQGKFEYSGCRTGRFILSPSPKTFSLRETNGYRKISSSLSMWEMKRRTKTVSTCIRISWKPFCQTTRWWR